MVGCFGGGGESFLGGDASNSLQSTSILEVLFELA